MVSQVNNSRVIVSLDYPSAREAMKLVRLLDPNQCRLKIGKELFTASGPDLVESLVAKGYDIFLDLKYHDIPNTVARACSAAARLGVWMLNVHTSGGRKMLSAAREAVDSESHKPLIIGVTLLTSLSTDDLMELGIRTSTGEQVLHLAGMAKDSGLDGVVCSAQESGILSSEIGRDFILVTPGIRPAGAEADDQKRIMTPAEAIRAGSHYLVIGRPITSAGDPLKALSKINEEIESALKENRNS